MKLFRATVAIAIVLASCHEEVEPSREDLLTVQVADASYLCCGQEVWVFATNENGEVLDVKEMKLGKVDTLRGIHSSDKITLTVFNHLNIRSGWYSFQTYPMIATGSQLKLGYKALSSPPSPPASGIAHFEIENYKGPTASPYGLEFSNGMVNGESTGSVENGVYRVETGLSSSLTNEIIITGYREGVPVYAVVNNIKDGDVVKLDYNVDFKPHEKVIDLVSMGAGGVLFGRYNGDRSPGRILGSTNALEGTMLPRKIGYIDGFDSYYSTLSNFLPGERYFYTRNGTPVPTNFKWPSYDVTITDRIVAPQFTTPTKFVRCVMNLEGTYGPITDNIPFLWSIHGEKSSDLKLVRIPQELLAKYPKLAVNALSLASMSIIVTPDQFTYQSWLSDQFSGVAEKTVLSEEMVYYKY